MNTLDQDLLLFLLVGIAGMFWGFSLMVKVVRAIMPFWSAPMPYTHAANTLPVHDGDRRTSSGSGFGWLILLLIILYIVLGYRHPEPEVKSDEHLEQVDSNTLSINQYDYDERPRKDTLATVVVPLPQPQLGSFALQVGAYRVLENAQHDRVRFDKLGHNTQILLRDDGLYRLLILTEHAQTPAAVKEYAQYYGIKGMVIALKDI